MDVKTKAMVVQLGGGLAKKGLMILGTTLLGKGIFSDSSQVANFVSIGMVLVGAGWSFWDEYGRAIVTSQLEVLKAKSLAQAAKLQDNGIKPVTVTEIAAQHDTLSTAEVTKTIASLPVEVQATVAKVAAVAILLLMLGIPQPAEAQIPKPRLTGNLQADIAAAQGRPNPATPGLTGNPLGDIIGALDVKLLPDLQYALRLATASGSRVTGPCYQAWIDIINVRQKAVQDDAVPPQAIPMPDPHLVTDFEKLVELRNSLQPDSEFMIKCSPVASMVKKDIVGFIGIVISGGAGLATLVPGL